MRRDDHLVGAEGAEGVLDRLQRVAVANLAPRLDPRFPEPAQALLEPLSRLLARAVDIRREVPDGRVQRRRDDKHLCAVTLGLLADLVAQRLAADGLVRDDEDAPLVRAASAARRLFLRDLVPTGSQPPDEHG